jgi:hypothetical protein
MSAQELVGAGGVSLGALTAIGSDLSVSVSFQVASELLDAAHETGMKDDELVVMVLGVVIALSALKMFLQHASEERRSSAEKWVKDNVVFSEESKRDFIEQLHSEKSLLDFALLFVSIASRIAFAVTVQLLAASARARQTSRGARILSLMGLAVFVVFVESSAERKIF